MNHIILIGHGKLAYAMKNSAEMIFGKLNNFTAIDFLEGEGLDSLEIKIEDVIKKNSLPVLILADLFSGTPFNAACAVAMNNENRTIEILSGLSLPLVLEAASMNDSLGTNEISAHLVSISNDIVKPFSLDAIKDEEVL